MADPLSIAASVGGLALLARDIVKLIASVTDTVRGATSQLQELRKSVALLCGYLESLSLIIDDDDDTPAPMSILACNQTLEKIRRILEKFDADATTPASTSSATPTKHNAWRDVKQKLRWVIDKDEAEKLLADLDKHKSTLSLALSKKSLASIIAVLRKQDATLRHIDEIRKEQSQIRQQQIRDTERRLNTQRRRILNTVSDMRPEDSFKKHFSLHQDGTGVWFLRSPEFEKFMNTPNSKLWLYGIPGAGKSVLSATIIDHISTKRTEHVATAYFFCEYFNAATQTCRNIFGSIARQLALQNPRALETLEEFFNDQTDLDQLDFNPEDDNLLKLIVEMSTNFDSTIIVVDGLDECQENRSTVVESLVQLSGDTVGSIRTLFTSRKESDIEERLTLFDSLAIAAAKADVRLYVAAQLKSRFRRMCDKDPALSEQILTVLVEKSEGMFQWVRCQIDCLANLASNKQRRKALEDLPRDLHGTYERILLRAIKVSEHTTIEFVERTLRWIALAREPLSVAEMAHAISVEVEERSFDDSLDMHIVLALCSSLVREVNGKLAFSHFSVKEYLMKLSPEEGQVARFRVGDSDYSFLARTCLTYLLLGDFDRQGCLYQDDLRPFDDERDDIDWIVDPYPRYPFYNHAAFGWMHYAEVCRADDAVLLLKQDLFSPGNADQFLFWAHLLLGSMLFGSSSGDGLSRKMNGITRLHLACMFCFVDLVDILLCNGAKANSTSALLGSPLQCAISGCKYNTYWCPDQHSRYETVRRLLNEPVSKDQGLYDPISDALYCADEKVAHLLLKHGFIPTRSATAKWESEGAPELDEDFDQSLGKKFEDPCSSQSTQDFAHRTKSLSFLFTTDYVRIVRESCSFGRLQNVKKFVPRLKSSLPKDRLLNFLSQCLVETAAYGHADIVQFLIKVSADPTFQRNSDGRTALHEASSRCHVDIVRILLETNDNRTTISGIQDNHGLTPWMCAIKAGSIETLELFLTSPSSINLQTAANDGETAAHLAARNCNEQMISYLKEIGVDLACLDAVGRTPVHTLLERYCSKVYVGPLRQMFRCLQHEDMLGIQIKSGQTLLHMIAQLNPAHGKLLWQDIRDNEVFDTTRSYSLIITDSQGNTPLHSLVINSAIYLNKSADEDMLGVVEFVQLLSTGNDDESEQLHMKNDRGRTPIMEFAGYIKDIKVPYTKKQAFSEYILRVFKSLGDARKGQFPLAETDSDNCTVLHYISGCRANFPSKEITEYILESPIDVTAKDSSGECALLRAAQSFQHNVEFMRLLIPRMSFSQLEEEDSTGCTILHYICETRKDGIQDLVNDCLLEPIAKCEKKDLDGRIPLIYAPSIITDDAIASRLIQLAENTIDICDNDGKTCMYWSCELGSIAMISALLDAGVNIDASIGPESGTGTAGDPPLLIAAFSGQFDVVEFLLDRGADPLVKGRDCWQLHHHAFHPASHELLAIVENLTGFNYDAKANFYTPLCSGREDAEVFIQDAIPLHFAAVNGAEEGLQWLLEHDKVGNINIGTRDGSTPLILASLRGHRNMCQRLIELGSFISKARSDGYTALHVACQYGHLEVCKLLIARENDCVYQKLADQTPLDIAAGNGHRDIFELLLKHETQVTVGEEINPYKASDIDVSGSLQHEVFIANETLPESTNIELHGMPLKAACEASSESTLVEVLQKDINPNIRLPNSHVTPLHLACWQGWKEAVKLLVDRGADMEVLDQGGWTPLMISVKFRKWKCTELLCQRGACVTCRDAFGLTVLHVAAQYDDFASLSYFLKEGIEANVRACDGTTPLHWAISRPCLDLLLEHGADPFILGFRNETPAWRYCNFEGGAELIRAIFDNQPEENVQQNIETFCAGYNSTSLYRAAFLGNSDVVSTLIEYGAKVNGHCGPLGAPLHAALRQGHVGIATTLLENGARPYRVVRDGEENAGWFWEYGYEFCLQGENGVWIPGPF